MVAQPSETCYVITRSLSSSEEPARPFPLFFDIGRTAESRAPDRSAYLPHYVSKDAGWPNAAQKLGNFCLVPKDTPQPVGPLLNDHPTSCGPLREPIAESDKSTRICQKMPINAKKFGRRCRSPYLLAFQAGLIILLAQAVRTVASCSDCCS